MDESEPICRRCQEPYTLRDGDEPTGWCDQCAQACIMPLLTACEKLLDRLEPLLRVETRPTLALWPKSGVEYVGVIVAEDPAVKLGYAAINDATGR